MALSNALIKDLEGRGWWIDAPSAAYREALRRLDVGEDADFFDFYSHAEGLPNFLSEKGELLQLAWCILNTNYMENSERLKASLRIPAHYIVLDSFEAEGGYLYHTKIKGFMMSSLAVIFLLLSTTRRPNGIHLAIS